MRKLRKTIHLLSTVALLTVGATADAQIVYDSMTDSFYNNFVGDPDEEADRIGLASIEHPITKIRVGVYSLGTTNSTLVLNIYAHDPKTGFPGDLLATSSAPIVGIYPIVEVNFDNLELTSPDIWVGFRVTPPTYQIGARVGFGPTLGRSESNIAYRDQTGWHYYGGSTSTDYSIMMQILMAPK